MPSLFNLTPSAPAYHGRLSSVDLAVSMALERLLSNATPMLAVLAEANFVLHARLRSGNSGAGQGAAQFLSEALRLLGSAYRVRCVRADSGFYADTFLSFLEERARPYIVRGAP
jgi:hypothetical protein